MPSLTTEVSNETQTIFAGSYCQPEAMSLFSSISISMLAYNSTGETFPVKLCRSESFPSHRFSYRITDTPYPKSWAPSPPPKGKAHLELTLGTRIAEGRIGLVYEAHVSRVTDSVSGEELSPSHIGLPATVCVKVAKPEHCRSLAREAWIYEQFPEREGYQGAVVPRCFGFFTVPINDCTDASGQPATSVRPWAERVPDVEDSDEESLDSTQEREDGRVPDWLDDDLPSKRFGDDACASKTSSPWNVWRHRAHSPLISLLLMERLGDCYSIDDATPKLRNDLRKVLKDVATASICHQDTRYTNVLQAPSDSAVCPRHGCQHKWRLIDFDRSFKTDVLYEDADRMYLKAHYSGVLDGPYFSGDLE